MTHKLKTRSLLLLTAILFSGVHSFAQATDVTIAYQATIEPSKIPQADHTYEKVTGDNIAWRKFESGASVITAVASGDVQIGYVGSSPLSAAASRGLPVTTFLIAAQLGAAEALVVRDGSGITQPEDLLGKRIAVPFVSTTHYSLLSALKHWHIDANKVQIINLQPSEIPAAWHRGDIDAAYIWDPAQARIKQSGKVLVDSQQVAKWGAPTFDAWIVRNDFAEKHADFVKQFTRITLDAYSKYHADPKVWEADQQNLEKISKITGDQPTDIVNSLHGSYFPVRSEQIELLGEPVVKALTDTSAFLKEQGKIDTLQADYHPFTSTHYVKAAQ
jgi:taurine transport system substrate-binding protein